MMYKSYWNMTHNPFSKDDSKYCYESKDYKEAISRLKFLTDQKGFGLFTGLPGTGKTYALKTYLDSLNKNLYKIFYTPLSTVTIQDFYRNLAYGLDIEPSFRKAVVFRQIQERMISLSKSKKITPIIVLDEAQYLSTGILNDLKIMFNFNMDACQYAIVVLVGLPQLNDTLIKSVHEAIAQRIVIHYTFMGMTRTEMDEYVKHGLSKSGADINIFQPAALESLYAGSSGSVRKLNSLISRVLIIGAQNKIGTIDTETIMIAQNEMNIA